MMHYAMVIICLLAYVPTIWAAHDAEHVEVLLHNKLDGIIILELTDKGTNFSIGQGASVMISLSRAADYFAFYYEHSANKGVALRQEIRGLKLPFATEGVCELSLVSDKDNAVAVECNGERQSDLRLALPEIVPKNV